MIIIPFEKLQEMTGYDRPTDVARCLRDQGIPVLKGKGGRPFTTVDAINQTLGVSLKDRVRLQDEV